MSVIRRVLSSKIAQKFAAALSTFHKNYSDKASEFVLHSDLEDVNIPKVSLDEYLFENTHKWPERTAAECALTGRKYTYEEVQRKSINLSRNFRKKLKLQQGDVIAVLLTNSPEFVIATLGAVKAGLIMTTLNPIYTPHEISRQLIDSSAKAIVTFCDFHPLAKAAADLVPTPIRILTIKTQQSQPTPPGAISFDEFTENVDYADPPPPGVGDVVFLPYSSGTTGLPKGVRLTHGNIISNLCQFSCKRLAVIQETSNDHQDVVPAVLPKFHIYGLMASTLHLFHKGCKTVAIARFSPELYLDTLRIHKPHVLYVAPPLVHFLTGHDSVTSRDLESVRTVVCGAAPLGALDEERFLQKAQKSINVFQGYGLTETSPLVTFTRSDLKKFPNSSGTIGRPISQTSVKIVDPNDPSGTPLGPNQIGELFVKGPQVMKGYHNRPEEDRNIFTQDGWLKTGDMMCYNDDKLLFIKDRLKELIKVKGFQVPPAELEEVIRDHPDVEDTAVIGVPHPKHGEAPRAYVVPKEGKRVDVAKLEEFVAAKVAPYKRLIGGIEIVSSVPKNAAGKILRRILKEQYEEKTKKVQG